MAGMLFQRLRPIRKVPAPRTGSHAQIAKINLRIRQGQAHGRFRCTRKVHLWWPVDLHRRFLRDIRTISRPHHGKPHRVALIPQAVEEIKTLSKDNDWLFPQRKGTKTVRVLDKPIDPYTPAHVLNDALKGAEIAPFTPHDLRRTMATQLGDMGFLDEQIGLVLNHTRSGVTQRYNRSVSDEPKLAMAAKWADQLATILGGKGRGKVIAGRFK